MQKRTAARIVNNVHAQYTAMLKQRMIVPTRLYTKPHYHRACKVLGIRPWEIKTVRIYPRRRGRHPSVVFHRPSKRTRR